MRQAAGPTKNRSLYKHLLLVFIVVALTVMPLLFVKNAEFGGADDKARQAISTIKPDYHPWFSPVWEPPSGEIATLIFSLQAAIGASVIGYGLGYYRGRSNKRKEESP